MDKKITPLLKRHPEGLNLEDILRALRISRKNRSKVLEKLKRLEKEGRLHRSRDRWKLPPGSSLVRGRLVTVLRGFGFVTPEGAGQEDIFIPARYSGSALQGDVVEVLVGGKGKKGKPEGRITRVLKKSRTNILGVYAERQGNPSLAAYDSMAPEEIPIRIAGKSRPIPGMIVEADRATRELTGILGFPDDPGVDTRVVIQRHGLASEFPETVLRQAKEIRSVLDSDVPAGRTDHRGWQTVTIDGEKARDFDDAVSIRLLPNGHYLLGVHIADVSHFVRPGTELDKEAFERATSVYFPDLTLPMLPERLSNDLCSLKPREKRLTVSVILEIDGTGRIIREEFNPSVVRTVERLTYTSVFKILEGDADEREKYARLVPSLLLMRDLARLLREKRAAAGSLDFDLVEPELIYEEGTLASIVPTERNEAHRLIEEFMVAANVAVASHLARKGIPAIYRAHPAPSPSDLEKLRDILARFGIGLPRAEHISSRDLQNALERMKGRAGEKFLNGQILRSLKLAVYSVENLGHYGLAKKEYTHFTSPIRRYPDLIVHRILKKTLAGERPERSLLADWALHCSQKERQAVEAERDLLLWRIFRFLKKKLGEEFSGIITEIARSGFIVELDDTFTEGLLPFHALGGNTPGRRNAKTLQGRKKEKTFDLGDRVRVILVACDPVLRRMEFILSPERVEKT